MHQRRRSLALAGLVAAFALAVAVSPAPANRLGLDSSRFTFAWEILTFEYTGAEVRCGVTLDGTFHSTTYVKTNGRLVGYVNRATLGACTGGNVTVLTAGLPWHLVYTSFSGTLPLPTSVRHLIIGLAFAIEEGGGLACLLRTTTSVPGAFELRLESRGRATGFAPTPEILFPLTGSPLCEMLGPASYRGTAFPWKGGTTTPLTVTLV